MQIMIRCTNLLLAIKTPETHLKFLFLYVTFLMCDNLSEAKSVENFFVVQCTKSKDRIGSLWICDWRPL